MRHIEKEEMLRENVDIMEGEVNSIVGDMQEREQEREQARQALTLLNQDNEELGLRVGELDNILETTN